VGIIQKSLLFSVGLASFTKEKAEKILNEMVEKGEVGRDEAKDFLTDLLERGQQEKAALQNTVKAEVEKVIQNMGLATKQEVEDLKNKITLLEAKLARKEEEA
jgi:polyhydroxyalkanoate synthesis regulator phasin